MESNVAAFRLSLVLSLCLIGATASGQTLSERLDPVIEEVDALSGSQDEVDEALKRLQTSIETHLYGLEDGEQVPDESTALQTAIAVISQGSRNLASDVEMLRVAIEDYQDDFLASHIERLVKSLDEAIDSYGDTEYPHDLLEKFSDVASKIEAVEMRRSVYAVAAWAKRLNDQIATGLPATQQPNADAAAGFALFELAALRETLLAREQQLDPLALSRRVTDLATLLRLTGSEKITLTTSDYRGLSNLRDLINTRLNEGFVTGIHVIAAEYGHIGGDRSGGRCNVTATLRQACQKRGTCEKLTQEIFAGFCGGQDPAPFARSSERGIRVSYNCLTATETYWTNTVASGLSRSHGGVTLSATLRSPVDNIVCDRP